MADDDDDVHESGFQLPTAKQVGSAIGGAAAGAAAAAAATLAARAFLTVENLAALANRFGLVTVKIDSSAIAQLSYQMETGAMAVTFTDGSVYPYPPVSIANFLRFMNAPSKGRFYNAEVRGKWG